MFVCMQRGYKPNRCRQILYQDPLSKANIWVVSVISYFLIYFLLQDGDHPQYFKVAVAIVAAKTIDPIITVFYELYSSLFQFIRYNIVL